VGQNGEIVLNSSQTTILAGNSQTSATGAGDGGSIYLLGPQVGLTNTARVNASGNAGGGTILVGGDYHGQNPDIENAKAVFVGAGTTLQADSLQNGNGGKVIVWADNASRSYGNISAQGGSLGGDGGFVENSSGKNMDFHASVNVMAPHGKAGTLLLDPSTITIEGGNVTTHGINTYSAPNPGAKVNITAGASITVGASIDTHGYMASPGGAITLTAGGSISVQGSASLIGNSLNMQASRGIYSGAGTGPVLTQVGSLYAANSGSGTINISNSGGNLNVTCIAQSAAGGSVTIANTTAGYGVTLSGGVSTQGGAITLQADNLSIGGGTLNANGSSPITMMPLSAGHAIYIGGTAGQFPGSLQLTTADLDAALPSGGHVVIGNSSAGNLEVDTSWSPSIGQLSLSSGGAVTVTSGLSMTGSPNLTGGTGVEVNSAVTATGGTVTLSATTGDITEASLAGITSTNLVANATAGAVTINSSNNTVSGGVSG